MPPEDAERMASWEGDSKGEKPKEVEGREVGWSKHSGKEEERQ